MCSMVGEAMFWNAESDCFLEILRVKKFAVKSAGGSEEGDDVSWPESWRVCSTVEALLDGREK